MNENMYTRNTSTANDDNNYNKVRYYLSKENLLLKKLNIKY
jgi:hypothetical protein